MNRWGEDLEPELQKDPEINVHFTLNFKTMDIMLSRLDEETREWDSKHPKDKLMILWASIMTVFFVLFVIAYQAIAFFSCIFFFFYGYILFRIAKTWKRFQYSRVQYWLMTVVAIGVVFAASRFIQPLIFGK